MSAMPPTSYYTGEQSVRSAAVQVTTAPLAIAGLILAIVAPIVGMIVSIVALPSTGRGKRGGRGLATAGAVIGGVLSIGWVAIIATVALASGSDDTGQTVAAAAPAEEVMAEEAVEPAPTEAPAPEAAPLPAAATPTRTDAALWRQIVVDPAGHAGEVVEFRAVAFQYDTNTGADTFLAYAGPSDAESSFDFVDIAWIDGDPAALASVAVGAEYVIRAEVTGPVGYATDQGAENSVPGFQLQSLTPLA